MEVGYQMLSIPSSPSTGYLLQASDSTCRVLEVDPVACAPHRIIFLSPSAPGPQSLTGILSIYYFFL